MKKNNQKIGAFFFLSMSIFLLLAILNRKNNLYAGYSPEETITDFYRSLGVGDRETSQNFYSERLGEIIKFFRNYRILKSQPKKKGQWDGHETHLVIVEESFLDRTPLVVQFFLRKKGAEWKIIESFSNEERDNLDLSSPEKAILSKYKSWERKDMHSFRKCYGRSSDSFDTDNRKPFSIEKVDRSNPGVERVGDVIVSLHGIDSDGHFWRTPYILRSYKNNWRIIDSSEFDDGDFPPDGSAPMYDPTFQPSNP